MSEKDFDQIMSELSQWGNLNSAVQFLVKNICIINNWHYGEIWMPSDDERFMIWNSFWSKDDNYLEKFSKFSSMHKFSKGIGLIGKVWEQKKAYLIENLHANNIFLRTDVAWQSGFNAAVSIPVLIDEKVLCVFCFFMNKLNEDDKEQANYISGRSQQICKILSELN